MGKEGKGGWYKKKMMCKETIMNICIKRNQKRRRFWLTMMCTNTEHGTNKTSSLRERL